NPARALTVGTGGGGFDVAGGTTLTVAGNITGSAAFTKSGSGTLNLSGNNTFQGSFIITGGMVNLNASTAGGGANIFVAPVSSTTLRMSVAGPVNIPNDVVINSS